MENMKAPDGMDQDKWEDMLAQMRGDFSREKDPERRRILEKLKRKGMSFGGGNDMDIEQLRNMEKMMDVARNRHRGGFGGAGERLADARVPETRRSRAARAATRTLPTRTSLSCRAYRCRKKVDGRRAVALIVVLDALKKQLAAQEWHPRADGRARRATNSADHRNPYYTARTPAAAAVASPRSRPPAPPRRSRNCRTPAARFVCSCHSAKS